MLKKGRKVRFKMETFTVVLIPEQLSLFHNFFPKPLDPYFFFVSGHLST